MQTKAARVALLFLVAGLVTACSEEEASLSKMPSTATDAIAILGDIYGECKWKKITDGFFNCMHESKNVRALHVDEVDKKLSSIWIEPAQVPREILLKITGKFGFTEAQTLDVIQKRETRIRNSIGSLSIADGNTLIIANY